MSLDTKYRPSRYEDVLGQEATIAILREYVASGRGFRQSYLFAGGHGSGKTTLGRILARALLCKTPNQGSPCGSCPSCRSMMETGTSADFSEVDAATNSGKADMLRITEELQYAAFSGKQHIYLFDEAHQLSTEALDALLKPMEETVAGTSDKRLVCIFCTTEPDKMRATILSRCAPAFVIRPQPPEDIAKRLAFICDQEGMPYEMTALKLIAELTECHVRDALKAIEGVSMLGGVTVQNAATYLHLDLNITYIDLLDAIGADLRVALDLARTVMQRISPRTCYEKLADLAMLAFRAHLGEAPPAHWNADRINNLGRKGTVLLGYASRFSARPTRATSAMLLCDIAHLHHVGGSVRDPSVVLTVASSAAPVVATPAPVHTSASPTPVPTTTERAAVPAPATTPVPDGKVEWDPQWGEIPQRAVNRGSGTGESRKHVTQPTTLEPETWVRIFAEALELGDDIIGPPR